MLAFRVQPYYTEVPNSILQLKATQQYLNTDLIWGERDKTACISTPAERIFCIYRFCLIAITSTPSSHK